jgi:hypothetical protein
MASETATASATLMTMDTRMVSRRRRHPCWDDDGGGSGKPSVIWAMHATFARAVVKKKRKRKAFP